MMELLKKHIHMNRRRGNVTSQMTLDDDFNVPDSMDDVEELIMENGEVKIESVKNPGEKAEISGNWNSGSCTGGPAENSQLLPAASRLRRPYICRGLRRMTMCRRAGSWMT